MFLGFLAILALWHVQAQATGENPRRVATDTQNNATDSLDSRGDSGSVYSMAKHGFTGSEMQWRRAEKILGSSAPQLNLTSWTNSSGKPDMQGKVVIVHFWETTSPSGTNAVPQTIQMAQRYSGGKGAAVVGAYTNSSLPAQIQEYVRKQGILYPIGYMNQYSARPWNLPFKPTYGVIDQSGRVAALGVSADYAERIADALLSGQAAGRPSANRLQSQQQAQVETGEAAATAKESELLARLVVPTKEKPVTAAEHPIDRQAITLQTERYMQAQSKSGLPDGLVVPKFEAASDFPGDVPKGAARISRKVEIDKSIPDWHSTGLYAAPGETITVTIPETERSARLSVRIGALTDKLWKLDKWERYPEISIAASLGKAVTRAANPFGGHVYIVAPSGGSGSVLVQIDGAVDAPYYVFGATTDEEWKRSRQAPAPWAELASDRVVITVPSHLIRELDNPKAAMQFWNGVLDADAELAGWPRKRARPERITADRQISNGWMHSGYPVMTPTQTERGLVDIAYLAEKGDRWGFFHEFGHNHQSNDWTFKGTTEVTVNLFTLYNFLKQYNTPIGETRREMRPDVRKAAKEKHLASGAPFDKWQSDPFLALAMYVELIEAFGWEPFKDVFAEYRKLADSERPRNDNEKRDQWMRRFSKRVGKNLGPFFDQWGVPVSQAAKDSIAGLPVWLPE
jgi:hypothetical protein